MRPRQMCYSVEEANSFYSLSLTKDEDAQTDSQIPQLCFDVDRYLFSLRCKRWIALDMSGKEAHGDIYFYYGLVLG